MKVLDRKRLLIDDNGVKEALTSEVTACVQLELAGVPRTARVVYHTHEADLRRWHEDDDTKCCVVTVNAGR